MIVFAASALDGDDAGAREPPNPKPSSGTGSDEFHLIVTDLYAGLETETQARRVRSSAPGRADSVQKNRDLRIAEILGVQLAGDVLDPNLFDWRAAFEFGLTQDEFNERSGSRSETDRQSGGLLEYDVSFDAIKSKPLSVHGFARRKDDRVSRRFLPSLRERQTEAGVSALTLAGPMTTEFGFAWRDVDRTGNRRDEDDEHLGVGRFYVDSAWAFSDDHTLRLSYEHEREESTYQGSHFDFDTTRDELRLEHELAFGPASKHRLDTLFRIAQETGDLARDEIEFVPRLALQHTDKLRTVYRYGFHRFEQGALEVDQHKLDLQALYQATDHLRFSLDGYGLHEDMDQDVETREFGGGVSASYLRPTAWGELSADVGLAFDRARTRGRVGRRVVLNEAHALGGSRPVYLREVGVAQASIVAHDAERTRVYLVGVDYTVVMNRGRARIRRVPTGRIAQGDVVHFDYAYDVPLRATEDTVRTDLLLEHAFEFGLTPYYAFEGRFQEVEPATLLVRDNMNRHRFGMRYGPEHWTLGAEYEIFDDSIEPYDAFHLTGQAALLRSDAHSVDLSADLSRYFFEGGVDRRRVWWLDVDVRDRRQMNRHLAVVTGVGYRWEEDSVDGTTQGVDLEWGLRYQRGYLTVELTVEYDLLAIAHNRESGVGVFLNIRRNLSHVLTPRAKR